MLDAMRAQPACLLPLMRDLFDMPPAEPLSVRCLMARAAQPPMIAAPRFCCASGMPPGFHADVI